MPRLCAALGLVVALLAWKVFDLDLASALLLGAALAPTDPVLASDVQVGPPHEEEVENVRFSLTAEAGMNDGTAFPFTWRGYRRNPTNAGPPQPPHAPQSSISFIWAASRLLLLSCLATRSR